jgi:hypothetical protein
LPKCCCVGQDEQDRQIHTSTTGEGMMLLKQIRQTLERALLHNGELREELYEYDLEQHIDYWKQSMIRDQDEFLFVAAVHTNDVDHKYDAALLLMEKSGEIYVNEPARERLKELWGKVYSSNMRKFIPLFAQQLKQGDLAVMGVKVVETFMA